jgi:hypothetical protein
VSERSTLRIRHVLLPPDDRGPVGDDALWPRTHWRAKWLLPPDGAAAPFVVAYRLRLEVDSPASPRIHLSADERCRFFVDGQAVAVGPPRSDVLNWRFMSYDLELCAGTHWLAAELWWLGEAGPIGQASARPGFILAAEGAWHERVSTGAAPWEARRLDAYGFERQPAAWGIGERAVIDGARLPWGWQSGEGGGFAPARPGLAGSCSRGTWSPRPPILTPATLPPQIDEEVPNGTAVLVDAVGDADTATPAAEESGDLPAERVGWQALLDGGAALTVPAGTIRRCLVDLGAYRSVWPLMTAGGAGGRVRLRYAEALFVAPAGPQQDSDKGDRRQWRGKFLRGAGPVLRTAGGPPRAYWPLEWECGRYVEIVAAAGGEPLVLSRFVQRATGYPLADEGGFAADDGRLGQVRALAVNTMRVGTHETYFDCPYYERLQYVGDARLEVLVTYCMQVDDRLPRQAIDAIAASRLPDGMLQSRGPCRELQVIPPFALWWIHMLDDYARWRGDAAFVRRHLPTARGVLDWWWSHRDREGLVASPVEWNFVDWVRATGWKLGVPSAGEEGGVSTHHNWHLAWTLSVASAMEDAFGEPELAALHRRRAAELAAAIGRACWDDERGRWRDAPGSDAAGEHGQVLALLSGLTDADRSRRTGESLARDADLARTTIYFTHYLFEAYRLLGRADLLLRRMGLWFDLEKIGLLTTPECPEPTRSDCHPWGAHPLYHMAASLAGIRPAAYGFAAIEVRPQPGPLRRVAAKVPHPAGAIVLEIARCDDGFWRGRLAAPVPARTPAGDLPPGRHAVEWRLG